MENLFIEDIQEKFDSALERMKQQRDDLNVVLDCISSLTYEIQSNRTKNTKLFFENRELKAKLDQAQAQLDQMAR